MKLRFAMIFQSGKSMEDHLKIVSFDKALFSSHYCGSEDLEKMTLAGIADALSKIFRPKDWLCTDYSSTVGFVVNGIVWEANRSVAESQQQHSEINIENSVIYMPQSVKSEYEQHAFLNCDYPFTQFNGINIKKFQQKHPDIEINYQDPLFIHHLVMDGYAYMRSLKKSEHELVILTDKFNKPYITWQLIKEPSSLSMTVSATGSALYATGSALSSLASWGSSFFVRPNANPRRSSKFFCNVDFSNLTFKKSDFAYAYLNFTDFSGATIDRGDFSHADARFAKFRDSKIDQVNFSDADLRFADFKNCTYRNLIFNEKTLLIGHDLPAQEKLATAFLEKLNNQISSKIANSTLQQSIDYFKKMLERMRAAATGKHGSPAKLFFLVQQWVYKESSAKRTDGFITGVFKEILVGYRDSTYVAAIELRGAPCNNFSDLLRQESAQSAYTYANQCVAHYEAVTVVLTNTILASKTTSALFKAPAAATDDSKKHRYLAGCIVA